MMISVKVDEYDARMLAEFFRSEMSNIIEGKKMDYELPEYAYDILVSMRVLAQLGTYTIREAGSGMITIDNLLDAVCIGMQFMTEVSEWSGPFTEEQKHYIEEIGSFIGQNYLKANAMDKLEWHKDSMGYFRQHSARMAQLESPELRELLKEW